MGIINIKRKRINERSDVQKKSQETRKVCDSMPFYMNCGKKLPEGAESCPKCGTQVAAGSKPEKKDYSDIGGTFIMVGGALKIVLPFLSLTFALLFLSLIHI